MRMHIGFAQGPLDVHVSGEPRTITVVSRHKASPPVYLVKTGDDGEVPAVLMAGKLYYFDGQSPEDLTVDSQERQKRA